MLLKVPLVTIPPRGLQQRGVPCSVTWSKLYKGIPILIAFATGWIIWNFPPSTPLGEKGMHFLATLTAAVILWVFEVFAEYIVALMLLLSWVVFHVVPSKIALAGFSESSWFFVIGALGMAAAVASSGLLQRLVLHILRRVPPDYHKTYAFFLFATGLLATPLLPSPKGRIAITVPVSRAISEAAGFKSQSNESAALALSAFLGFSQMSFMFLTGSDFCLAGWNLLPYQAKAEFSWLAWFVASLPAGIFIFVFLFAFIHLLLPLRKDEQAELSSIAIERKLKDLGPFTNGERICLFVLVSALAGWISRPLHGIDEDWIALMAMLILLITGVLDKNGLRNNIDWGFLLFFGIINSTAAISSQLGVDRWLVGLMSPILSSVSVRPLAFLLIIMLLVYFVRIFLRKMAATMVLTLALLPWAGQVGIHPGILLLTIVIAVECFFLSYQDGAYQIAYYSTDGRAFSHAQARKLMVAKLFASLLAVTLSVPYWSMLGFMH